MSCGKKPLVKKWDRPRKIQVVKQSRFEKNEPSVKQHWKNVMKDLELRYNDEKFWDNSADIVKGLLEPKSYGRVANIFGLSKQDYDYIPKSENETPIASELFYDAKKSDTDVTMSRGDISYKPEEYEGEEEEEHSDYEDDMTESSQTTMDTLIRSRTIIKSKAQILSKTYLSTTSTQKLKSKSTLKVASKLKIPSVSESKAKTNDDIEVHVGKDEPQQHRHHSYHRQNKNPFFNMLYCSKSETDMITWNSKYKQRGLQVSASDEFSRKIEIMAKKIAIDFYNWWNTLGNYEFKSEIRRYEDIESLFQLWFDEHASRSIVMESKILPCVAKTISDSVNAPALSCPSVLKRQLAFDIKAEACPSHVLAFGKSLPQKMKRIPPKNNTKELWKSGVIPTDLKDMSCVWGEILHLTSSKSYHNWLLHHPNCLMPPCFEKGNQINSGQNAKFAKPSDMIIGSKLNSAQDLALPISQFGMELKDVLDKLMNQ